MKRFISILLTVFMTISMVSSMAFATSYTDEKEINYKEAVDVMSAVGILCGYSNGEFGPEGNLTRAAAAKIITYLMIGNEAAERLSTSVAPYTDVPIDHWASGYIAYLAHEGVVDGYGDGTFRPNNNVTAIQFAKMLLGALGYDSEIEGLIGNNWSITTSQLAYNKGLFEGNESAKVNIPLTREEAALYAFNALKANTVYYTTKGTEIIIGNTTIVTGASEAITSAETLAEKLYHSDLKQTPVSVDKYGNPATQWSYKGQIIGTYSEEPVVTFATAFNGNELINAVENAGYSFDTRMENNKYDVALSVRGNGITNITMNPNETKAWLSANAKTDFNWSGNGVKVDVFADDNGIIDTIVVTESVFETVTTKVEDRLSTKNTDERVIYTNNYVIRAEDEVEGFDKLFDAIEEDDSIIVIANGYEVITAYVPTTVRGTVSYFKPGYSLTINGVNYSNSKNANILATAGDENVIAYIDAYGYVIATDNGSTITADSAVVLNTYSGLNSAGEIVNMALILYSNGTTERVEVGSGNPEKGNIYIYTTNTSTNKIDFYPVVNSDIIEEDKTYAIPAQTIAENTRAVMIGSNRVYFSGSCKFVYVSEKNGVWEYTISNKIQSIDASVPLYGVINQYGNISTLYILGAAEKNTIKDGSALIFIAGIDGFAAKLNADGKLVNLTQYVAFIDGVKVNDFVSENTVTTGFYSNEYDNKNGCYILAGNQYDDTNEDIQVTGAETLTKDTIFFDLYISVDGTDVVLTEDTVYASAIEDIEINSLAELKSELNDVNTAATVYVVYNNETSEALYIYITNIV